MVMFWYFGITHIYIKIYQISKHLMYIIFYINIWPVRASFNSRRSHFWFVILHFLFCNLWSLISHICEMSDQKLQNRIKNYKIEYHSLMLHSSLRGHTFYFLWVNERTPNPLDYQTWITATHFLFLILYFWSLISQNEWYGVVRMQRMPEVAGLFLQTTH